MLSKRIRYTFKRSSIYYVQFSLPEGKMFRRSLDTDSHREASALMIALMPQLLMVKGGLSSSEEFNIAISSLIKNRMVKRADRALPPPVAKPAPIIVEPPAFTLGAAWNQYKAQRGSNWTIAIASANDRYIEPLLAVLGDGSDVERISKRDINNVMEAVEGLPKRVVQPYRAMTIQQLLACDDVAQEDLIGTEAIHKHLKLYKSLFKTFLTDEKGILTKSPTDGVTAPPSSKRFGAYSVGEMRSFVSYAINHADGWLKWIILLLAYTGARRGEIATLTKSQVCFDDDSIRHYLLITDGKTDNAARQVPIHQHLIELGFLEFVERRDHHLFLEVSGSNMNKISKEMAVLRERLNIPYRDIHNQRRIVHSFRHSVVTAASGWVNNIAHLQQVIGHEKTGTGITARYMHTFPLNTVSHVIDKLNWMIM
ncbi:tyrosine-type recombinase/integrase [Candidatus Pantoea floridensis]|uniref:Phage integrase family protein n=1 Tax=Candidatus Pantoea floridensis TaxID=1938870 RepID=A0A286BXI2_9GAMM|nr:tyrosine-type recombinase/integrase [Pantoea floridensis]PIF21286.1 phage integrase family protein [Enterobacteriaceae bacterium JKS000233]SOD38798.1 Phage integrase family protein [Pantoea floridensis]